MNLMQDLMECTVRLMELWKNLNIDGKSLLVFKSFRNVIQTVADFLHPATQVSGAESVNHRSAIVMLPRG